MCILHYLCLDPIFPVKPNLQYQTAFVYQSLLTTWHHFQPILSLQNNDFVHMLNAAEYTYHGASEYANLLPFLPTPSQNPPIHALPKQSLIKHLFKPALKCKAVPPFASKSFTSSPNSINVFTASILFSEAALSLLFQIPIHSKPM